jgi:2,4-dienoyl-CoA reductase-like NADH-dependent reductase (Old Yellow Enzyme family)
MRMFEPLDINGMVIPNRIMVPAMVTRLSGDDGHVTAEIIDRYVRYSQGQVGLIVVEAMAIHDSKSGPLCGSATTSSCPDCPSWYGASTPSRTPRWCRRSSTS